MRWHQLTLAPSLLHTVQARMCGTATHTLEVVMSGFCDWLFDLFDRAVPHLRRLHVELPYIALYDSDLCNIHAALAELLDTLPQLTQRGCQLQDFSLAQDVSGMQFTVPPDGWGLPALRRLSIPMPPEAEVLWKADSRTWPCLEALEMSCFYEDEDNDLPLPPCLTRLCLALGGHEVLHPQASTAGRAGRACSTASGQPGRGSQALLGMLCLICFGMPHCTVLCLAATVLSSSPSCLGALTGVLLCPVPAFCCRWLHSPTCGAWHSQS